MHGYFIDQKLYNKIMKEKAGISMEEKMVEIINQKIEEQRESRISLDDVGKIKVKSWKQMNKDRQEKLREEDSESEDGEEKQTAPTDDRFADLMSNPAFEIDSEDDAYIMRNADKAAKKLRKILREGEEDPNFDSDEETTKQSSKKSKRSNKTKSDSSSDDSELDHFIIWGYRFFDIGYPLNMYKNGRKDQIFGDFVKKSGISHP